MKRGIEIGALCAALAVVIGLGWRSAGAPSSTYSSYDTGTNGYMALFNVLQSEGVDVTRLTEPLGQLPANVGVFATTPDNSGYDANDTKRLTEMIRRGIRVVAFRVAKETFPKGTILLDARLFSNVGLERKPVNALIAYRALAGRGVVAFDEHRHGYGTDRTMWSIMPAPIRIAVLLTALALLIAVIGANVRNAPPIARELPDERDSSAYIVSMARLLRRSRAAHVPVPGKDYP